VRIRSNGRDLTAAGVEPRSDADEMTPLAEAIAAGIARGSREEAAQAAEGSNRFAKVGAALCTAGLGIAVGIGTQIPPPTVPWEPPAQTVYVDPCSGYVDRSTVLLEDGMDEQVLRLDVPTGCPAPEALIADFTNSLPLEPE
jgi:hypothetical protein